MPHTFRIGSACVVFLIATGYAHAQSTRVRVPSAPSAAPVTPPAPTAGPAPVAPTPSSPANLRAIGRTEKEIDLVWDASTEVGGTIALYRIERCQGVTCDFKVINTSSTTSYDDPTLASNTSYTYRVTAQDANGQSSAPSKTITAMTAISKYACSVLPTRPGCMNFASNSIVAINAFYQTNGPYSFFSQIKSIYNQASSSATVSADLATLNFASGMQVTVTTNAQVGSSGATAVSSGTIPTLSGNGAGQAAQNILYGGTFLASELYPLFAAGGSKLASPGGLGLLVDFIAKEGADIQNFKSGANVNVTSPPFHGSAHMEGYVQYNSINLAPNSQNFAGSLFFGGSYGYNYMSHGYARDYGFANKFNNGIGQISFGIVINGVARITVSRAFGPSQTYIDSTTMAHTTANNFKAWSFGVGYQSPTPSK
jgi:Fibronectin type III domain